MEKDPITSQLLKQHPEMEYFLTNPSMMKSMLSPDMMEAASGMMSRMRNLPSGSTMSGTPGSFPAPGTPQTEESKKSGTSPEKPASPGHAPQAQPTAPTAPMGNWPRMNPMFNPWSMFAPAPNTATSTNNAPNQPTYPPMPSFPTMSSPFGMYRNPFLAQMMANMYRPPIPSQPTVNQNPAPSTVPQEDLKKKYAAELKQMKEMGFENEAENIKALQETNGNVFEAVDKVANLPDK